MRYEVLFRIQFKASFKPNRTTRGGASTLPKIKQIWFPCEATLRVRCEHSLSFNTSLIWRVDAHSLCVNGANLDKLIEFAIFYV